MALFLSSCSNLLDDAHEKMCQVGQLYTEEKMKKLAVLCAGWCFGRKTVSRSIYQYDNDFSSVKGLMPVNGTMLNNHLKKFGLEMTSCNDYTSQPSPNSWFTIALKALDVDNI